MAGPTDRQRTEIRDELERAIRKLTRSLEGSARASRPVELDQTSVGRLSRMDAIQSQSMSQGLQEREQARLAQLRGARARLDDGTYGRCTGCGAGIPHDRLLIFPETLTCADCASG